MPSNTKKVLLSLSLAASPLLVFAGCGGGGDGLSPTPTPTVTSLPFPMVTATTAPTNTPEFPSTAFQINATFSNVSDSRIGTGFQSTDGQGLYNDGENGKYASSFDPSFSSGGINNRQLNFITTKDTGLIFKKGDILQLSNDFSTGNTVALFYSDGPSKLGFTAKSGKVRIDDLEKFTYGVSSAYRVKFTIINAVMVADIGDTVGTSKGQFTINATAETTTQGLN